MKELNNRGRWSSNTLDSYQQHFTRHPSVVEHHASEIHKTYTHQILASEKIPLTTSCVNCNGDVKHLKDQCGSRLWIPTN